MSWLLFSLAVSTLFCRGFYFPKIEPARRLSMIDVTVIVNERESFDIPHKHPILRHVCFLLKWRSPKPPITTFYSNKFILGLKLDLLCRLQSADHRPAGPLFTLCLTLVLRTAGIFQTNRTIFFAEQEYLYLWPPSCHS